MNMILLLGINANSKRFFCIICFTSFRFTTCSSISRHCSDPLRLPIHEIQIIEKTLEPSSITWPGLKLGPASCFLEHHDFDVVLSVREEQLRHGISWMCYGVSVLLSFTTLIKKIIKKSICTMNNLELQDL